MFRQTTSLTRLFFTSSRSFSDKVGAGKPAAFFQQSRSPQETGKPIPHPEGGPDGRPLATQAEPTHQEPTNPNPAPKYNALEFEPFKFRHERESLIYGYSLQELYGKRYGLKHSPAIQKEIAKDNIMVIAVLFGVLYLMLRARDKTVRENEDWGNYIYHDMNTVRPIQRETDKKNSNQAPKPISP